MKKILLTMTLLACNALWAQSTQEYARYDPATFTWEFNIQPRLVEGDTDWVTYQYVERNHFKPKVTSTVRWNGQQFAYNYRISNDRSSKQTINYLFADTPILLPLPDDSAPSADILNTNPIAMREWQLKLKAQRDAKKAYQNSSLSKPIGWRPSMSISDEGMGFGWFPAIEPYGPGVPPGRSASGFELRRPDLPGVVLAEMQGRVEEPALPDGYKLGGPVEQAINKILENDSLFSPILAPAITVPVPYNGAELSKRIKTHVGTWLKLGLITQDTLDRLNRGFDSLIAAQTYNNIAGTHAAVKEILQEAYSHHHGLNHSKNEEDDDEHDAEPVKRKAPATVPLNRVAARALSFDLTYLLTRAYIGK
ncbi:MAG: hypothetical protein RL761_414 [Pseudomonadota bacterium]|jgi:hypothetical protein